MKNSTLDFKKSIFNKCPKYGANILYYTNMERGELKYNYGNIFNEIMYVEFRKKTCTHIDIVLLILFYLFSCG